MNGLLTVKRKQNGYRIYTNSDIGYLKIIRSLRCANYSLAAILRMLNALSCNPDVDIREVIDTPKGMMTLHLPVINFLHHCEVPNKMHYIYWVK